jgi:hypothetical protein
VPSASAPGSTVSTATTAQPVIPATTSTTIPQRQPDSRFVPTGAGGAPLVGCPSK